MAKVKVVNTGLDSNLNGVNFNNTPSETIFSFGSFNVTSNFDGRTPIDYTSELSSFVRSVTLETLGVTETQSQILHTYATNAVLNLDKSDLNTFVRYGSAYEFLRLMIEGIILAYPGSLFMNSQMGIGGNPTLYNYSYDTTTNISRFEIPVEYVVNKFGLVFSDGNQTVPDNSELKNLNLSYDKYIVWSATNPTGNSYSIIGFTGFTTITKVPSLANYNRILLEVNGKPFIGITGVSATSATIDFHIKPNNFVFEEFRALLNDYQKYILSQRDNVNGFKFILKDPTLLEDGSIIYGDTNMLWATSDKYNIDIDTPNYRAFLNGLLNIGGKYDAIKTDLIARFLTPASLKTYDLTEEGKMTKLLRIYGREFDELRQFIDSLVNINKVTYNKVNNIPDQLVKNLANTFGWNYFSLVNENELVESFLTIDDSERNLNTDLLPAEIDIELWRRILINTNYFWKSKGTREAIKSMFLLIGIPEPFINITEYVYTVDGKINPNTVPLSLEDLPSSSLPYDSDGYPIAPTESSKFYFQVSGDTDSGQAYMDVFRMVGFNLTQIVDNKKSWVQAGAVTRIDDTTPQYNQEDSKLVLNTKEVDVALDTARGIEYDVFDYIKNVDFPANSSGYTIPYKFINISLGVSASQNTFQLPVTTSELQGDWEVRYNGILLNAPKEYNSGGTYQELVYADYSATTNTFTLLNNNYAYNNPNRRDVITATYVYSATTSPVTGISIQYMVTRVNPNMVGTTIQLPSAASGDVQLTINGIALTKGTPQFTGDYIVDSVNPNQIIIQNPEFISYFNSLPPNERFVQVAYVGVTGNTSINARSEIYRVDSFSTGKLYYNSMAGRYVYKLNYKVNNANEVKLLIDGIGLEPLTDYNINIANPYEIFLPAGIKYGSVISAYYLVGGVDYFNPIVGDVFGLGDISQLSFLEFIELLQRRMINARNRKTVTDFKGGWYPTLLNIYIQYLKRANLESNNPLLSNGYTFENLYSFLSKYNAFFQRFVDQLLSATIILKKGGLLIRNSVFTKQKFTYKRGVNLYADNIVGDLDMRGMAMVQYMGDDGSEFIIGQTIPPPPPPPPTLYVETIPGTIGSIITGGRNIVGYNLLTEYGVIYKKQTDSAWQKKSYVGSPGTNTYTTTLTGLDYSTNYEYRAFICSGIYGYTGNSESTVTPAAPVIVSLTTRQATSIDYDSIDNTGGNVLPSVCGNAVDYYGMQYKTTASPSWTTTTLTAGSIPSGTYTRNITSLSPSTAYQYRAYAVINGTPYYGCTCSGSTIALPTYAPTVNTGNAANIAPTTMRICGNSVSNSGGLLITEYGILFTQVSAYGNASCLVYDAYPAKICKKSIPANIETGTLYFTGTTCELTGLAQNTTTYFRAFAKNTTGVGNGTVKSAQTTVTPKLITMEEFHSFGVNYEDNCVHKTFKICSTPAMSVGDSYNMTLISDLHVGYYKDSAAYSCIKIFCNGTLKAGCCITRNNVCCEFSNTFVVDNNDAVDVETIAHGGYCDACGGYVRAGVRIVGVSSISGVFQASIPNYGFSITKENR